MAIPSPSGQSSRPRWWAWIRADGVSITNNWIGTTGTGTTGDGNSNNGINVQGANTVIGGTGVNDGNVITNNGNEGINLIGTGATGTVNEVAKLLASDGGSGDQFGVSVSVSGDTAIVGAYLDDDHGGNSGSAYVFDLSGATGTVNEAAKLLADEEARGFADYIVVGDSRALADGAKVAGVFNMGGAAVANYVSILERLR